MSSIKPKLRDTKIIPNDGWFGMTNSPVASIKMKRKQSKIL